MNQEYNDEEFEDEEVDEQELADENISMLFNYQPKHQAIDKDMNEFLSNLI